MANIILTNSIIDPLISQPWTGPELQYLQGNISGSTNGLALGLIGDAYSANTGFILYGLDAYGTNQYNNGYVFYNNELFYSSGKTSTLGFTNVPVMVLDIANDPTVDPLMFSDNISRDVTNTRTLKLVDALAGTGLFDLTGVTASYLTTPWKYIGASGQPAFKNSWLNNGSPYSNLRFKRDGNFVIIDGVITTGGTSSTSGSVIFTLPIGFRPLNNVILSIVIYSPNYDTGVVFIQPNGDLSINYTNGNFRFTLSGLRYPLS